jgi:hypothetical protein
MKYIRILTHVLVVLIIAFSLLTTLLGLISILTTKHFVSTYLLNAIPFIFYTICTSFFWYFFTTRYYLIALILNSINLVISIGFGSSINSRHLIYSIPFILLLGLLVFEWTHARSPSGSIP